MTSWCVYCRKQIDERFHQCREVVHGEAAARPFKAARKASTPDGLGFQSVTSYASGKRAIPRRVE